MYKVLVVEDEEVIRKGLISFIDFEKLNCMLVGEAENGNVGVKLIKELEPDIVITDINMPVKNGIEMIEETLDYNYSTIIISGYSEFGYAKKAIRYGVSDYLLKPIEEEELEEVLLQAIEQRQILKSYQRIKNHQEELSDIELIQYIEVDHHLVNQMLQYVKNNFHYKITMEDVSNHLHYSESSLNKCFKKEMNITFNEYLNRYRVQKAIDYMRNGELSLNVISEECGFSEYKYFNVVFRKYINCSPSQFKKLIK